jgi:hypothetical protein
MLLQECFTSVMTWRQVKLEMGKGTRADRRVLSVVNIRF